MKYVCEVNGKIHNYQLIFTGIRNRKGWVIIWINQSGSVMSYKSFCRKIFNNKNAVSPTNSVVLNKWWLKL